MTNCPFISSWEGALNSFLLWAAREPYTFLLYVLIGLSPFLCISAILSYKLSKELKKQVRHKSTVWEIHLKERSYCCLGHNFF